jgi:hypothetical protein
MCEKWPEKERKNQAEVGVLETPFYAHVQSKT